MTTSRPNTNFKKITFNASWDNQGQGLFFTSNRQLFNNIFYLDLNSRKITTIANYRGSNLRAVQNPRNSQVALILSSTGNRRSGSHLIPIPSRRGLLKIEVMNLVLHGLPMVDA